MPVDYGGKVIDFGHVVGCRLYPALRFRFFRFSLLRFHENRFSGLTVILKSLQSDVATNCPIPCQNGAPPSPRQSKAIDLTGLLTRVQAEFLAWVVLTFCPKCCSESHLGIS